jgi:hypothetical protein
MREALFGGPGKQNYIEGFFEARLGLFERDGKPLELAMPITLADSEIEPAVRHQIRRRGLLGKDYGIVPRQYHHRGAEANRASSRR